MGEQEPSDVVYCQRCGLPHGPGKLLCDACSDQLGDTTDSRVMRRSDFWLRIQIAIAASCIGVLVLARVFGFLSNGYFVCLTTLAWLVFAAARRRTLSARPRAAEPHEAD